jgi:succinylglutamate desuccinylase
VLSERRPACYDVTVKKVTILAAIHGDETYGIDLYRAFILAYPHLLNEVQLIIGNELAHQQSVRFIDSDMNRHYADTVADHESMEMQRVANLIADFTPDYILDIHTTRRNSGVFFISDTINDRRQAVCNMLDIDVCVMKNAVIEKSFIGHHDNAVSLEYSLHAISDAMTQSFVNGLAKLVQEEAPVSHNSRLYDVVHLITRDEWLAYPGLKNHDKKPQGLALMIPADVSEIDTEYFGFWCKKALT